MLSTYVIIFNSVNSSNKKIMIFMEILYQRVYLLEIKRDNLFHIFDLLLWDMETIITSKIENWLVHEYSLECNLLYQCLSEYSSKTSYIPTKYV